MQAFAFEIEKNFPTREQWRAGTLELGVHSSVNLGIFLMRCRAGGWVREGECPGKFFAISSTKPCICVQLKLGKLLSGALPHPAY